MFLSYLLLHLRSRPTRNPSWELAILPAFRKPLAAHYCSPGPRPQHLDAMLWQYNSR